MPMNPSLLDNPKSDRIRRVADLANAKARRRSGRVLVEGPQSVREAVAHVPDAVSDLYVLSESEGADTEERSPTLAAIVDRAERCDSIYIHRASEAVMHRISPNAQGISAVVDMGALTSEESQVAWSDTPTIAAFWQVRDPGNAGAVIRAADAAGCDAVIFVDDCVDRFNPKVVRSTAGSLFHIPVLTMGADEMLAWCSAHGIAVVAADIYGTPGNAPRTLPDMLADRVAVGQSKAVLFGNEARGLPRQLLERVDRIVTIPIYGKAESLNLATSAAVMLFSLAMSSHMGRM